MKKLFIFIVAFAQLGLVAQTLNNIESVEYDPVFNRYLVSNGNSIIAISGDGEENLSFFGEEGTATASHGMEVVDDKLFAISGDEVRAYALVDGALLGSLSISEAAFMNGMTHDASGILYVTDFSASRIYKIDFSDLDNPIYSVLVANTQSTPNGIVYDEANNRLIFVNWGASADVKQVDLSNNEVSTIIGTSFGNLDGIDEDNQGNYYISSWSPNQVFKMDAEFALDPEVITVPGITSPADICYSLEQDTLAIPNGNGTVSFVGFETEEPMDTTITSIGSTFIPSTIEAFPNPANGNCTLRFYQHDEEQVQVKLIDLSGKMITTVFDEPIGVGPQEISIDLNRIDSGPYTLQLRSISRVRNTRLLVH